jgi:anti-anti-sigma factor
VFEYHLKDLAGIGLKCIAMAGRIDALSASSIQKIFEDLVLAGERTLLADMADVTYVSSAGLRIFLVAQKELKKVGGEIILSGITDSVFEIFRMSGFTQVFRIIGGLADIAGPTGAGQAGSGIVPREIKGIMVEYVERECSMGSLLAIGSPEKAETASFAKEDVVEVRPTDMEFGCGLAALGSSYEEYKALFGESMTVKNNFFFYPAVKQSAVDFVLKADEDRGITYKMLHGFGFRGDYRYLLSFKEAPGGTIDLAGLIMSFMEISSKNVIGFVIIAESKGVWAMHLKQPPIKEL